jgi:hypothetical protein
VAVLALLAVAMACALASRGAPRLTLRNADVYIAYPWPRPMAALGCALAAAALAFVARLGWARTMAGVFALAAALAASHLALYRVRAGTDGVEARGLLGSRRLPWMAIKQVQTGPDQVLLTGSNGERVRVDTTDFRPEDRASLDRTIARRLRPTP